MANRPSIELTSVNSVTSREGRRLPLAAAPIDETDQDVTGRHHSATNRADVAILRERFGPTDEEPGSMSVRKLVYVEE